MPDTINMLAIKRSRLLEQKRKIKEEYDRKIHEIDQEIKKINNAMQIIEDALKDYLCPRCKGSGEIRMCDAAGQMCDETCPKCGGTGIMMPEGEQNSEY